MEYILKYKKSKAFFWTKRKVVGHMFKENMNRMDMFSKDGAMISIANWNDYDMCLGTDWVLATSKRMESESGQSIKLADGVGS